ncbi:MAG: formylglycine-generating enzyme family protein [Janthinobacterium lividum]
MPSSRSRPVEAMVRLSGGRFRMGSDRHYPEEAPSRAAAVPGFWIDRAPVTNREFAAFVGATGYCSVAEALPDPGAYPGADPAALVPGSIVFRPPGSPDAMRFWGDWWAFVPGAHWRHPDGSARVCDPDHPVVHVAHADAAAYAAWAGKSLPTEAEWEFAARGGEDRGEYAWGDELAPDGAHQANTWQGRFPFENLVEDGFAGTSPVGAYPPNGFGLVDMIGNVWEWTDDPWSGGGGHPCCAPAHAAIARRVIKGGSHLCAPNYCRRYRPAARQPQAVDSGTSHLGFRCVLRND